MSERIIETKKSESVLKSGFSLMETMVVLLIVAIIAAATTPMITKKMTRNAGAGESPWVFTGLNNDISYPNDAKVLIGTTNYNANGSGVDNPRLVLAGGNGLAFADASGNFTSTLKIGDSIQINNANVGENTIAIGLGQNLNNKTPQGSVLLGYSINSSNNDNRACHVNVGAWSETNGQNAIAIGRGAKALGTNSIAIGCHDNHPTLGASGAQKDNSIAIGALARAEQNSVAIGSTARTAGNDSIVIGGGSHASANNTIAIGSGAKADAQGSIAIGNGAVSNLSNHIVLGTPYTVVHIPGYLVVDNAVMLGRQGGRVYVYDGDYVSCIVHNHGEDYEGDDNNLTSDKKTYWNIGGLWSFKASDRRLKNVDKEFAGGLEELKKLQFFHYTFKKDEAKTPHVGVIAQDLQKVFPDAVTKSDDGYLRIRMEDMFYAAINAIKELDAKICAITSDVKKNIEEIASLKSQQEEQQKMIKELQKQNADLIKRIEKLEKAK